jgi:hypothetical protein
LAGEKLTKYFYTVLPLMNYLTLIFGGVSISTR